MNMIMTRRQTCKLRWFLSVSRAFPYFLHFFARRILRDPNAETARRCYNSPNVNRTPPTSASPPQLPSARTSRASPLSPHVKWQEGKAGRRVQGWPGSLSYHNLKYCCDYHFVLYSVWFRIRILGDNICFFSRKWYYPTYDILWCLI